MKRIPEELLKLQMLLTQVVDSLLTSQELANWCFDVYWDWQEGTSQERQYADANLFLDILYDIIINWECLVANQPPLNCEFSKVMILNWSSQIKQLLANPAQKLKRVAIVSHKPHKFKKRWLIHPSKNLQRNRQKMTKIITKTPNITNLD